MPIRLTGISIDVEVFTPTLTKGTTNLDLELWDGGTSGTFLTTLTGHMTTSQPEDTRWS